MPSRNTASAADRSNAHASTVRSTPGVTLYLQLASLWRSRIVSGEWRLGDQLPTVAQLAATHGAAAVTVRHALRMLVEEGLISSARGRGTFVCGKPSAPSAGLRDAINDPKAALQSFDIDILRKQTKASLPDELLGTEGRRASGYQMIEKRHLLEGQAFCTMQLFIDQTVMNRLPRGAERRRKLNGLLLDHASDRLDRFQTTITIAAADAQVAELLGVPFATPAVRIVRRALDADDVVVYAGIFWYRSDGFVLDIETRSASMLGSPGWMAPRT